MARNLKRYYQAWELRQQNKTFKEIGKIMGLTGSRVAVLSNFIDFKIEYQHERRISNELKDLVKKYRLPQKGKGVNPPERRDVRRPEAEADPDLRSRRGGGGKESRATERGMIPV